MTTRADFPQASATGGAQGPLTGRLIGGMGTIPDAWWAGVDNGPSVALPDGRSVFFYGSTTVDDTGVGDAHGDWRSNTAVLYDRGRVTLANTEGPLIPDDNGTWHSPVGAVMLDETFILVCCRGISPNTGQLVSTNAALLHVEGEQVLFDHFVAWPDAADNTVGPQAPVSYHAPVMFGQTLVVFGTQHTQEDSYALWYATVPADSYPQGSAWTYQDAPLSTFDEADATCTAWVDELGIHVASAHRPGRLDAAVTYQADDLSADWERSSWVNYGPSLPGETRGRLYVHSQLSTAGTLIDLPVPSVTRTNYTTNPRMEATSGTITVSTNLATNPGMRTTSGYVTAVKNYFPDPFFKYGTVVVSNAGYSYELSTDHLHEGTNSLKMTTVDSTLTPPNVNIPIPQADRTVGGPISASAWVWVPSSNTDTVVGLRLGANGVVSQSGTYTNPSLVDQWQQITVTTTIATLTDSLVMYLPITGSSNTTNGDVVYLADVSVTLSPAPTPPISGDTPADDTFTYSWSGTAGASTSNQIARRMTGVLFISGVGYQRGTDIYETTGRTLGDGLIPAAPGDYFAYRIRARSVGGDQTVHFSGQAYKSGSGGYAGAVADQYVSLVDGQWQDIVISSGAAVAADGDNWRVDINPTNGATPPGMVLQITDFMPQKVAAPGLAPDQYYDGDTPADDTFTYSWTGTPDASTTTKTALRVAGLLTTTSAYLHDGYAAVSPLSNGYAYVSASSEPGEYWSARFMVRLNPNRPDPTQTTFNWGLHDGNSYQGRQNGIPLTDEPQEIVAVSDRPVGTQLIRLIFYTQAVEFTDVLLEKVSGPGVEPGPYFDGSKPDGPDDGQPPTTWNYAWTGDPNASASTATSVAKEAVLVDPPGELLYSVGRSWEGEPPTPRSARPHWGMAAVQSLTVVDSNPLYLMGTGIEPASTPGLYQLDGPGVTNNPDQTLTVSSTDVDPTPVTDRIGYTLTDEGDHLKLAMDPNLPSGVQLVSNPDGTLTLTGYTVITLPGGVVRIIGQK